MHLAGLGGAGPQRHRPIAGGADGEPGEQDRPGHHPRRGHARVARLEQALHLLEYLRLDDGRNLGEYLLGFALAPTAARLDAVEPHAAGIDGMAQQGVDRPEPPRRAAARAVAMRR